MRNKIILIIDNKADIKEFAEPYFFKYNKVLLHQEETPQEAFRFFEVNKSNIILILIDLKLFNQTGFDFLKKLKQKGYSYKTDDYDVILYSKHLKDPEFRDEIQSDEYKEIVKIGLPDGGNYSFLFKEIIRIFESKF